MEQEKKELERLCTENNETLDETTELLYACKYNKPTLAKYVLDKCQKNIESINPTDDPESNKNYFKYEPYDCDFYLNEDNIFIKIFFQYIDSENPLTYACKNNMIDIANQWLDIKNTIYDTYDVKSIVENNIHEAKGGELNLGDYYSWSSGYFNDVFKELEEDYFSTALKYMLQNNISGLLHKLVTNYVYYDENGYYYDPGIIPNEFDKKLILDEKVLSRSTKNTEFLKDYNELIDSYIDKRKKQNKEQENKLQSEIDELQKLLNEKRKNNEKSIEVPMKLKSRLSNWEPRNEII
jgi:gas vesicle protein